MKNILIGVLLISFLGFVILKSENPEKEYIRIHIQANSSSRVDEEIKFLVKDKINSFLADILSSTSSKREVMQTLNQKLSLIKENINLYLLSEGFSYGAEIEVKGEYFPTRSYEGYVVESGFYDALSVKLGKAEGNNWWCVLYPPLCLVEDEESFVIKSRFKKIIESFFDKKESV